MCACMCAVLKGVELELWLRQALPSRLLVAGAFWFCSHAFVDDVMPMHERCCGSRAAAVEGSRP
jgi:hypothetical protein